jgi:hypothetical protein
MEWKLVFLLQNQTSLSNCYIDSGGQNSHRTNTCTTVLHHTDGDRTAVTLRGRIRLSRAGTACASKGAAFSDVKYIGCDKIEQQSKT